MVKVFIIIGFLLIIAGVPGLYWASFQNEQQQQAIAICKSKYKHQVEEYVQKLTSSSLKPTDENAVNIAASAPNPEKMKPDERLKYQQERLVADIEELAESTKNAGPDADVIYGDGWQQKVADYKEQKQFNNTVQVASATGMIAGGVLFLAAFTFLIFRAIFRGTGKIINAYKHKDAGDNSIRPEKLFSERKVASQAAPVSNTVTQTAKPSGTSAEEFRKMLFTQAESIKEAVDQLKDLTKALGERAPESDGNLAKQLAKGFKIQHDSLKQETNLLKTMGEDIRKAVEAQSRELSKTVETSAELYTEMVRSEISKSRQDSRDEAVRLQAKGMDDIKQSHLAIKSEIEKFRQSVQNAQAANENTVELYKQSVDGLSRQIEGLSNIVQSSVSASARDTANTVRDEIEKTRQTAQTAHNEAVRGYEAGIEGIRNQIEELSKSLQAAASQQPALSDVREQLEQEIRCQAETLKKEIAPLGHIPAVMEQILEQIRNSKASEAANEGQRSEMITRSIADLTEQVGAIREYAARQQQRLAKLQDGYDWNLIKNFCLRVIRSIDNLDDRIGEISCDGGSVEHLIPVREELSFILESNGIEAFGAKIESDYRGQESRLQVLNERDETDDNQLIGKISQVVRPGYQSRVNEEYTKIIRPAQVRLFGPVCINDAAVRGE